MKTVSPKKNPPTKNMMKTVSPKKNPPTKNMMKTVSPKAMSGGTVKKKVSDYSEMMKKGGIISKMNKKRREQPKGY